MCFRLLLASDDPNCLAEGIERHGASSGLDVRARKQEGKVVAQVAWGECACSLYTRREGRERLLNFIEGLAASRIQLLFYRDGDLPDWGKASPTAFEWEDLCRGGLAALPEGFVVELRPLPAKSNIGPSARKP